MNIGLIGSQKAGQTTLLAALYNQMRTSSRFGFKLHGSRYTDIELSKRWKSIITQQLWPEASQQVEKHSIELIFNEEVVDQLDIYAYPAAFLTSESTDIFDHLNRMDNLIVLIDSEFLIQRPNEHAFHIQNIVNILKGFLTDVGDKKVFITIVFTKYDLVSHLEVDHFDKAARKGLAEVFKLLQEHLSHLSYSIISVSSTGQGWKEIPNAADDENNPVREPIPYNIALPMFVLLQWYMGRCLADEETGLWQRLDEVLVLLKAYSLRSEISDIIARRPSTRGKILKAISAVEEHKKQLARKKEIILAINQEINFHTQNI